MGHCGRRRQALLALASSTIMACAVAGTAFGATVLTPGAVFTSSNNPAGNAVLAFNRLANGTLRAAQEVATGGEGRAVNPPLGFPIVEGQGEVVLSPDGALLFVVNAGSNTISSFLVTSAGLRLADEKDAMGEDPTSLTVNQDGLLYVLNQITGNIAGYRVDGQGSMTFIPGSVRGLAGGSTGEAAEIEFNAEGTVLVATERAASLLDSWTVDPLTGVPGPTQSYASNGRTPFGFGFTSRDQLVVANAEELVAGKSDASSYAVTPSGAITPISRTGTQLARPLCWMIVTRTGRFAYGSDPLSNAISAFRVASDGTLAAMAPGSGEWATTAGKPFDMALGGGDRYFYVITYDGVPSFGSATIEGFRVRSDGMLTPLGRFGMLPGSASGIAAW